MVISCPDEDNLLIISADWFFFGGNQGIIKTLIAALAIILPFIIPRKHLLLGNIVFIAYYFLLLALTIMFLKYNSINGGSTHVIIVSLIEIGIVSGFLLLTGNIIVLSIVKENQNITRLNESLNRANTEINSRNKILKKIDETRNNFYNIIAHDLRGPIGTMNNMNELLLKQINTFSMDETKLCLSSLADTTKKTFSLLEDLLEWSKAETGKISINIKELEIQSVVQEVIDLLKPAFTEKGVLLETKLNPHTIYSDKNIIQTIVRNLLSNALKFTPEGKKILIKSTYMDEYMNIEVIDQGVGMSESQLKNLFNLEKVNTGLCNGLGLILCKQLAEKVGGKIQVTSYLQKGSTFCIKMPGKKETIKMGNDVAQDREYCYEVVGY
jgi:signal transduction histidine kinase